MIKQPQYHINTPISERLSDFLKIQFLIPFQEHSLDSFVKRQYMQFVETQKTNRTTTGCPYIYTATVLCQPFLFWNNGKIDIGGVTDYCYQSKTGTFVWNATSWNLILENVHSYYVFAKTNHDCFLCINSMVLPEKEELEDIYIAASIKHESKCEFVIYHKDRIIFHKDSIYPELFVSFDDMNARTTFARYVRYSSLIDNDVYHNYLFSFDDLKEYQLDDSQHIPSAYFDYRQSRLDWTRFRKDVRPDSDRICIFLHLTNSKTSQIVQEFIKGADSIETLPNIFDDDPTVNLKVTYINRPKDVRFLYYCMGVDSQQFGVAVFGIPVDQLEQGTLNNQHEQRYFLKNNNVDIMFMKKLVRELFLKCHEEQKVNLLPKHIYLNCISSHDMDVYVYQHLRDGFSGKYAVPEYYLRKSKDFADEKIKYKEIFQKIASEGNYSTKWVSEYTLFQLIQKEYPDAIYQYHSDWLGLQSLDIFVPSIHTGIEYQGKQHYFPIQLYGGEKGLEYNRIRDERKRVLCKENGVTLIEWKYNEPISIMVLKQKIL